jgi:hypothetical protein
VDPAAKDLLVKSLAAAERLATQVSKGEVLSESVNKDGKHRLSAQQVEMRRDKNRYDQIRWDWQSIDNAKSVRRPEEASTMRQMWDGKTLYDRWHFRGTNVFDIERKEVTVSVQTSPEIASRNTTLAQYPLAPLDGYVVLAPWPQNGPTAKTMQGMDSITVRPRPEPVNGSDCRVVEASNNKQQFTLWIDPRHGYHVARAEYKDPNLSASFSDVRFEQHGDVWVPVEGKVRQSWTKNGQVISEGTMQLLRTFIDLNPDFAAVGAFEPNLPEGTRVVVHESPGVEFEWRDGRMVPYIDANAIATIDASVAALSDGRVAQASVPAGGTAVEATVATASGPEAAAPTAAGRGGKWAWWLLGGAVILGIISTAGWTRRRAAVGTSD